ncbi:MAG: hypothetical protein M3Q52_00055, partial [Pseudomonadota bacterium]|nr:hypothetical protein [Pseudomonadota bacterium]
LTPTDYVEATLLLIPLSPDRLKIELAEKALDRCFGLHFSGDEIATMTVLLGIIGQRLNAKWVVPRALAKGLTRSVINRNLIVLNSAPKDVRGRLVASIELATKAILGRNVHDLDENGAGAFASLFWDARSVDARGAIRASSHLLPAVMQARRAPVSSLIAATFPFLYRELAQDDPVPELLKFIPFLEWDRCKAARAELIEGFLRTSLWAAGDFALTACRSGDVRKFLRQARDHGGERFVDRISADLSRLPDGCRKQVKTAISEIRSPAARRRRSR